MLSAKEIIESRERCVTEIPLFGVKDFEPDGSLEQSYQIQNSISEIKNVVSYKRVKLLNTLSQAIWQPDLQLAEVISQIGPHWTYIGHKVGQKLYIYPEEALYLLEAGCIQMIFNEVPLSVQRAYFVLFGAESSTTIEKYRVYSLLSSCGYKVLRHSRQNAITKYEKQIEVHKIGLKLKDYHSFENIKKRHKDLDHPLEIKKKLKVNKVITLPVCKTDDDDDDDDNEHDDKDVLKKAQFIQPHENNLSTPLDFDYDVYSETLDKSFRKSCLQLPNFRIIVHRGEDSTPDVEEICKLSNKYKDEVSVIHAIVFFDCVTFYKIDPIILPDAFE